jgi:hypothetical protein
VVGYFFKFVVGYFFKKKDQDHRNVWMLYLSLRAYKARGVIWLSIVSLVILYILWMILA